jgi:thioredoxin reductase (NADPH)
MIPDLAVVGAGPAGVAAALAAQAAGLSVLLLEAGERPGGQLHRVHSWVTGVAPFEGDGAAFATELERWLANAGIRPRFGARVEGLSAGRGEEAIALELAGGERVPARALLIASGLRSRALGVPGEREFSGRGVSTSATRDRDRFASRPVVVVGGGDAAFENALLLAAVGCRVTLVVRDEPRARAEFRDRVAARPQIELAAHTRVLAIEGGTDVRAVKLAGPHAEYRLETSGVFVKIGSCPNTEWCRGFVACDEEGFVRVDALGATACPGVWAAGDVARPDSFTVAAASATAAAVVADVRARMRG